MDLSQLGQQGREMEFAVMAPRERVVSSDSFDTKERVKQAIDIVDLVGSHISLRRQGRNYVGLCPWHDDSRPSLQVNPERQSFKCWVCDIGGDVFSFVMKMEGVEFPEALRMLAERAGIPIEKTRKHRSAASSTDEAAGGPDQKRTLLQAMAWAEKKYHECLLGSPEAQAARNYLQQRGISAESIEKFRLGFSPLQRDWILSKAGDGADPEKLSRRAKLLETVGILARPAEGGSFYDRFKGRLLFSIHDAQGRSVGIGGRVLPELGATNPAKYVNSPETPLFRKSELLYGLDLAREALRKTRTALVMEGYTDVIVAHQFGFQNAVAVLGTALGERHVRILKRHADRIVLVLDGDEAGTRRANEVLELFIAQQADLRVLTLPEGLDPCDYLQKYGAEAFAELLAGRAIDALDHAFEKITRGIDINRDVHGVSQAIEQLLGLLAKAPRLGGETQGDSRIREQKIVQRLAGRFRVDEQELRRRLTAIRRRQVSRPAAAVRAELPAPEDSARPTIDEPWERELLELLIARPECFADVRGRLAPERLIAAAGRRIFEAFCRLADRGVAPSFDRLMLEFDEPAMKSLLVELDEAGGAKGLRSSDAAILVEELLKTLNQKEAERRRPAQIEALREGGLDAQQQSAMLEAILNQQRSRQGISKPTDG